MVSAPGALTQSVLNLFLIPPHVLVAFKFP